MKLFKFNLTLVSFLFISSFAFSQKITGTISTLADRKISDVELVAIGDKVISIQKATKGRRGVGIDVVQYDMGMNEKKRVSLADEKTSYDELCMGIKKFNNKVYVITREDKKSANIIAVEVDPQNLTLSAPKIIAATENEGKKYQYLTAFEDHTPHFEFTISPDGHSAGLAIPAFENLFISILDENLNVIWGKSNEFKDYHRIYFEAFSIDNNHNAYFGYFVDYRTKLDVKDRYRYAVYTADSKVIDQGVDLGGDYVFRMYFVSTKSNGIAVTGGYLDTHSESNVHGLFTATLSDKNNFTLTNIARHPFSEALLIRANQERWGTTAKKQYGLIKNFTMEAFELEDGTLDVITEFHGSEPMASVTWRIAGAIMNFHFGKNDSTVSYIPKIRRGQATIGESYHAFPYKNKMIIFYNDNPDNLNNDPSAKTYASDNYSSTVLVAATVNENGTFTRKQAAQKEDAFAAMPELMFEVSENSLMIPLQNIKGLGGIKEGLRFATIKIE
ncbi:MAG: hypothetical protein QM737_21230 [Ferruginibacter sp.]